MIVSALAGCIEIPPKDPPCSGEVTVVQGVYGRVSRPLKDVSVQAFYDDAVDATVSDRGGFFELTLATGTYHLVVGETEVDLGIANGDVFEVGYELPATKLAVTGPTNGPLVAPSCH